MAEKTTEADDAIEFETENGASVAVTADAGTLSATVESDGLSFDDADARLKTVKGTEVLDCGRQRTDDGDRTKAYIPAGEHKDEIEALVEESKDYDAPLVLAVGEKRARRGGAGATELYLTPTKGLSELTDEQRDQYDALDADDLPESAEAGDEYAAEELLGDDDDSDEESPDHDLTRGVSSVEGVEEVVAEIEAEDEDPADAAREEAAEAGERVHIDSTTVACDGSEGGECSTDRVTRYATPDGSIEVERTHLH